MIDIGRMLTARRLDTVDPPDSSPPDPAIES
jgi:hypothetical protein